MCLGIPGRITHIIDPGNHLAGVNIAGVTREVHLACIVDGEHPVTACVGEWVLVHVGFAIARLNEAEAARTLALLAEIGELQEKDI